MLKKQFDQDLIKRLDDPVTLKDLKALRVDTASPKFYVDGNERTYTDIPVISTVPKEHHDTYVGANIVVPLGGALMQGR